MYPRQLVLYSTPYWPLRIGVSAFFAITVCWIVLAPSWGAYLMAALFALPIPHAYVRSEICIDYDKDVVKTKLWKIWSFVRQSRSGMQDATTIQIDIDGAGDTTMITKYLVFSDGEKIELPKSSEIERVLNEWYEHFFQRRLAIRERLIVSYRSH